MRIKPEFGPRPESEITIKDFEELKKMEPRIVVSFEELKGMMSLPEVKKAGWNLDSLKFAVNKTKEAEKEIFEKTKIKVEIDRIDFMADPQQLWAYDSLEYLKKDYKIIPKEKKIVGKGMVIPETIFINLNSEVDITYPSHPKFKEATLQSARHELLHKLVGYPITKDCKTDLDLYVTWWDSLSKGEHEYLEGWKMIEIEDYGKYFIDYPQELRGTFIVVLLQHAAEIAVRKLEEILWSDKTRIFDEIFLIDAKQIEEGFLDLGSSLGSGEISKREFQETVMQNLPIIALREAMGRKRNLLGTVKLSRETAENITGTLGDIKLLRGYEKLVENYVKLYENIRLKEEKIKS